MCVFTGVIALGDQLWLWCPDARTVERGRERASESGPANRYATAWRTKLVTVRTSSFRRSDLLSLPTRWHDSGSAASVLAPLAR